MTSQASYGFLHQALVGFEALARPGRSSALSFLMTPTLRSAQLGWTTRSRSLQDLSPLASTSSLSHSRSSDPQKSSASASTRSSSPSHASTSTSTNIDDASFRQTAVDLQHARQMRSSKLLPRRIGKIYARRPLARHLDLLRLSQPSFLSSRSRSSALSPFHTSARWSDGKAETNSSSSGSSSSGSSTNDTTGSETQKKAAGLMDRLKELTRKYGWATVAVYFLLSAVDFGLCFFVINLIGADHVRHAQDYLLDMLVYGSHRDEAEAATGGGGPDDVPQKGNGILGFLKGWREKHKIADADKGGSSGTSSIWATAVLAYTIHKTLLLPVRIGATAAATPAIVKYLQRFGINIARNPLPESVKQRGAQSIKNSRERIDKVREKNKDWL